MPFDFRPPAWFLRLLPARLARRYSACGASAGLASDKPNQNTRQLLVDVSVIHESDARTGIQRVVRSLLLQLLDAPPAGYCVCPVFATRQHSYRHAAPGFLEQSLQTAEVTGKAIQVQRGDLFLGLDLAAHLLPRHQAQLLRWKRSGANVHVLVYDLLPLQHPEWFNPKTTRNFKRWIRWLAVYADSAICISVTVKVELQAWLAARFEIASATLPASTIVLGANIDASAPSGGVPLNADFLLARMRSTPAVLMVGTVEPRKAYDNALAAFEWLWNQPSPAPLLVLVGRPGWKTDALQEKLRTHPQAGKRLFWLEDASDEFLARLYAACRGVLVASRAEGFGLPVIEAAMHRKPVLVRNIPVFREIEVADITYFDSGTPQSLANAVSSWLQSAALPAPGHTAASFPTWQLSASQLLRALGLDQPAALPLGNASLPDQLGTAA